MQARSMLVVTSESDLVNGGGEEGVGRGWGGGPFSSTDATPLTP